MPTIQNFNSHITNLRMGDSEFYLTLERYSAAIDYKGGGTYIPTFGTVSYTLPKRIISDLFKGIHHGNIDVLIQTESYKTFNILEFIDEDFSISGIWCACNGNFIVIELSNETYQPFTLAEFLEKHNLT